MRALRCVLVIAAVAIQAAGQTSTLNKPAIPPLTAASTPATPGQPSAGSQPTAAVTAKAVPVMTQIKKTVAFLELICQEGTGFFDVKGTGFFIAYPDTRLGTDKAFGYLVTNRHVAECWDEQNQNKPMEVKAIGVRLNLRGGSSQLVKLVPVGNAPWIYPDDPSVDLAVLPFFPDQKTFDFMTVPVSFLATDDVVANQGIIEGDKILFTGFFSQFPGEHRIQPIVREGILAMMPDEPMPTTTKKPGRVYLGDVHTFYGNSGSPVFVNLGGLRGGGLMLGDSYKLLGVVSGLLTEDEDLNLEAVTSIKGKIHANSGIAMIVPASAIKALLDDHRVQAMRDAAVAQSNHQHAMNCSALMGCRNSMLTRMRS